jgi:predicted NBD/HSP70 family sugar kinase
MISTNFEMKKNNTLTIFRLLQKSPLSKREIEKISALSWGTVSYVTNELLSKEFLCNEKSGEIKLGRTPDILKINNDKYLSLGIDINIIGLTYAVCDLSGNIIESETYDLISDEKEGIIKQLSDITEKYIKKYKTFLNISISMQGQIDKKKGISISAEHFKDWNNINVKEFFENSFNIKTYLYHDPDCLMFYYLKSEKCPIIENKNCIVLKLDEGIGMSILLNSKIFESNGINPEIGHNCVVINGEQCHCGKKGCLEAYFSLKGLAKIYENINPKEFKNLLDNKNEKAVKLLNNNSFYLGVQLSNLINVLNPEVICLDGILAKYSDIYIDNLKTTIEQNTKNNPEIFIGKYKKEAAASGACLWTISETLEDILFAKENE